MSGPRTAGIVSRALAAVLDLLVVLGLLGVVLLGVAGLRFVASPVSFRWPAPSWGQALALGALLACGYLTVAWAMSGRSCGAAVLGLRVRSVSGLRLGWVRAGLRAAFCLAFPPGLLWCLVSSRRRSIQDAVLGSVVVYDWRGARTPTPAPGGSPGVDGTGPPAAGHGVRPPAKEERP
jgi:uncharacterized RDD family membrane protein YckC